MNDYPINTCSLAALPLLIQARDRLDKLAAPQASGIAYEIGLLLEQIIELAGVVEAYGNKWTGGEIGKIADKLNAATIAYHGV